MLTEELRKPQTLWIRRALFQVHLWTGIAFALYLIMLSATGSLLVYRIEINNLQDHTFYARIHIRQDGQTIKVDSRPSDAIALGVATNVPIYVAEHVLDEVT